MSRTEDAAPEQPGSAVSAGPAEVIGEMARGLRTERWPVETTLRAITAAAVDTVPGAEDAGITFVVGRSRVETRATGERPGAVHNPS